jgi:hypothetical protein
MNMNVTMGLDIFVMVMLTVSGLSVVIYSEWGLNR